MLVGTRLGAGHGAAHRLRCTLAVVTVVDGETATTHIPMSARRHG
jgi:hypothetical protein